MAQSAAPNTTTAKPARILNPYTILSATTACLGSLLYGIDSGIISTTISHPTFISHFASSPLSTNDDDTASLAPSIKGAIVSTFSVGSLLGVILASFLSDRFSRLRTIQCATFLALVGGVIQAASPRQVGVLILGRMLGGAAVGMLNMVIPIYNAEISPTEKRGLVSGLHAQGVGIGFAVANWVGYGAGFIHGEWQWRGPLAFQCLPAILLLIGSIWLPFSPRWLLSQDRDDEALSTITKLNAGDAAAAHTEYFQMREQIQFEKTTKEGLLGTPGNRRRLALAVAVMVFTQLSGINVINYYQTDLYKSVGVTGQTVLLLAGIYGLVGPMANVVCLWFVDRWGRKKALWITGCCMGVDMIMIMSLTGKYGLGGNKAAQGTVVGFIFLFSVIYSLGYNSIHTLLVPELLPLAHRSTGSSIAISANIVTNIVLNQISPIAFANVAWRYYGLFVATNFVAAGIVYAIFPETMGKSLEEMGEIFGDVVVAGWEVEKGKMVVVEEEGEEEVVVQGGGGSVPQMQGGVADVVVEPREDIDWVDGKVRVERVQTVERVGSRGLESETTDEERRNREIEGGEGNREGDRDLAEMRRRWV